MDNVLIDSNDIWSRADRAMIESQGKKFKPGLVHRLIGSTEKAVAEIFQQEYSLSLSLKEISKRRLRLVFKLYRAKLKYMPYALWTLKTLKQQGYRLTLATSSESNIVAQVKKKLPEFFKYFEFILTGDQQKRSKPHPDIYLNMLKRLKLSPKECIIVEDSKNGILAGKRAGVRVIGLKTKCIPAKYLKPADYQINNLRQLPKLLHDL